VERDVTGTDPPFVGVEWMPTPVSIRNGKCCRLPAAHAKFRILHSMPMVARVAAAKRIYDALRVVHQGEAQAEHDHRMFLLVFYYLSFAGRGAPLTLDQHGVKFGRHTGIEGIDFYNEDDIIGKYYEEVRKLVLEATG